MCGVSGLYSNSVNDELKNRLARSLEFIGHRGPDSNGMYCSGNIVLGHTRLAIHDLTESGHQPMVSNNSSNALVFNGEIYNYQTLRRALPDLTFSGQSDTEVLLGYLDKYGVDKTLNDIDGMFAFAYWNKENQLLHLARDRMGEKPLYFKHTNDVFVFASELPALEQLTPEQNTIDPQAVNMFLRFGYIPAPLSIYHGIEKLEPGHRLTVSLKNKKIHLSKQRYYVANTKIDEQRTPQQTCDQLEQLLIKSVEQRLDADVPVGAFLSGGIDSSIIAAITKSALGRELDTFTIGFDEEKYDESGHAAEVAKHLGCNHHVKVVNERHMLELVPNLPSIYGEPFADSSQIPTLALCQQTKSAVTVAISGDGGDELFAGYSRYQHTINRWLTFQKYGSFIKNCHTFEMLTNG